MRQYEIWSEGYITNGERAGAHFHGRAMGDTFAEACRRLFKDDYNYDDEKGTHWGCRLFDNEDDARKSFG